MLTPPIFRFSAVTVVCSVRCCLSVVVLWVALAVGGSIPDPRPPLPDSNPSAVGFWRIVSYFSGRYRHTGWGFTVLRVDSKARLVGCPMSIPAVTVTVTAPPAYLRLLARCAGSCGSPRGSLESWVKWPSGSRRLPGALPGWLLAGPRLRRHNTCCSHQPAMRLRVRTDTADLDLATTTTAAAAGDVPTWHPGQWPVPRPCLC